MEAIRNLNQEELVTWETGKTLEKCTLYISAAFGVKKIECRTLKFSIRKYAQYDKALFIEWVEKGKRLSSSIVMTPDSVYAVAVAGWNSFEPGAIFGATTISNGLSCKQTRYPCYDSRYRTEFDGELKARQATINILADFRGQL